MSAGQIGALLGRLHLEQHLVHPRGLDPHVALLHLDVLRRAQLLELLALGVTEEVQVLALRVLGVLGEVASTLEQEREPPGWNVGVQVAEIVEPRLQLLETGDRGQQRRIHARVRLAHDALPVRRREGEQRLVRFQAAVQARERRGAGGNRGDEDVLAEQLKRLAARIVGCQALLDLLRQRLAAGVCPFNVRAVGLELFLDGEIRLRRLQPLVGRDVWSRCRLRGNPGLVLDVGPVQHGLGQQQPREWQLDEVARDPNGFAGRERLSRSAPNAGRPGRRRTDGAPG